jgi:mono/diheme cytochrome c family protein
MAQRIGEGRHWRRRWDPPRHLRVLALLPALAVIVFWRLPARGDEALSPAAQRGRVLVTNNCARCHAIDKYSTSPVALAPPFRKLHERYPVEDLEEPLAEGIVTGHPMMPEFSFDPGQVNDIISYLKTLEH